MLKIAISPCPNDVFIFSGLILKKVLIDKNELHFDYFDIETLNEKALANEFDLLKISYANYPRCRGDYTLLPSGGALGRGVGPLLLSNGADWNPDKEVMVPGLYTTANFLLDFWVQRPLTKKFVKFNTLYDVLREKSDAQGVVFHEKRFTYADDGLRLIQDLGEYWEEKTGFPIPLGCVIARKELELGLDAGAINQSIKQSLSWAYANKEEALALCGAYASDISPDVIQGHIELYVTDFTMEVGPTGESAVKFFLDQIEARSTAS